MKKPIILLLFVLASLNLFGQAPESFNYQAVVRDNIGNIVPNQAVSLRIGIRQTSASGPLVYQETHAVSTNNFGLVNLQVGRGSVLTGTFSAINWGGGGYYLVVEFDVTGGTSYSPLGTQQLISVPYALHAKTADQVDDADANPTNELQTMVRTGTVLTLSQGGGSVSLNDNDADSNNELQTLSSSGGSVTLSNGGGTVSLDDADADVTNELNSTITLNGTVLSITDAGGTLSQNLVGLVNDADASPSNELQNLSSTASGTNRTINITSGTGTTISVADNDNDASNELQNLSSTTSGVNRTINITGGTGTTISVADNDNDASNELNSSLTLSGSTLSLTDAGGTLTANLASLADEDADSTNEYQTIARSGTNLTLSDGGGTVSIADNDNSSSNELQTLSQSGSDITLSNGGGTVSVADNDNNSSNELQDLSSTTSGVNRTINITGGTGTTISVADNDNNSSNELQTLSQSGSDITLSNGGGTVSVADNDNNSSNELQDLSSTTSGVNRTINITGGTGTTISVADNDNNSSNELQTLSQSGSDITLSNGGGTVSVADNDNNSSNELQDLSSTTSGVNRTINITGGTGTTISVADNDNSATNEFQNLGATSSGTNRTVTITNGTNATFSIADNDNSSSNELQTLSQSGSNITLSNGGGTISVADNDNNSSNELQDLSSTTSGVNRTINISGGTGTTISVADNDNSSSNELQTLSKSGTNITLSNSGGTVSIADNDNSATNEFQNLGATSSGTNRTVTITNGTNATFSIADNDNSTTNEIQTLSISGSTISISGGNSVSVPSDADWTASGSNQYSAVTGNVGIGQTTPENKLHVVNTSSVPTAVVMAEGALGPTYGQLAVQGDTDHEGVTTLDIPGQEIGVLGISTGGSNTDNYGVYGHSNGWGGRFSNTNLTNSVNLGGISSAIQIIDGTQGAGRVLTSDAAGNGSWVAVADASATNEIQTLSYSGSTLSLSNGGGSVTIANGDITGVTAGAGLTGGGTTGTPTLTAAANNGLNVDAAADRIQLGGTLVETTTITEGGFTFTHNLNGTGDFQIQDNGTTHFLVSDAGLSFFGDDVYWRDGSTSGTNLMIFSDDADDGRLRIYENGITSIDLDANTQFVFNEQGLDRDFRVESDLDANCFRVNAGTNRVGIGDAAPVVKLEIAEAAGQSLMLTRLDGAVNANEQLGGIGFDGSDGNTPDDIREASAAIIAFASEDHGTGDKGGRLTFWTSPVNQDDDTDGFERLRIDQNGTHYVGGDMYWRDNSVTATNIARIIDDGDDGQFLLYENGSSQILLDANGTSVFNEQGLSRDLRVETDTKVFGFFVDASNNSVGVGGSAHTRNFHVEHDQFTGTGGLGGLAIEQTSNSSTWTLYTSQSSSNLVLYLGNTLRGNFDDATGAYTQSSDVRLKKNIETIGNTMGKIMQLRPTEYHFKHMGDEEPKVPGLIAQELKQVFPNVVKILEDDTNGGQLPDLHTVSYTELIPYMIKGMQEQQTEIQQLKNDNETLKKSLEELRKAINGMK